MAISEEPDSECCDNRRTTRKAAIADCRLTLRLMWIDGRRKFSDLGNLRGHKRTAHNEEHGQPQVRTSRLKFENMRKQNYTI